MSDKVHANVLLDQALIEEALALTGLETKAAVIEEALRVFTQLKRQENVRALRGQLQWEGDLDALRRDRFDNVAG